MKVWEIWAEGYITNGERDSARLMGTQEAETFEQACRIKLGNDPYYDATTNSFWGCSLYNNEAEARKSFG